MPSSTTTLSRPTSNASWRSTTAPRPTIGSSSGPSCASSGGTGSSCPPQRPRRPLAHALGLSSMISLTGSRILVVGGAGFIGSHVVDALRAEDVAEIRIYDNFCRGSYDNLEEALADPRVSVYQNGGDILHEETLGDAVRGCDYVVHLAALWLLHCHEFPRAAFEVNVRGTFNVLEACRAHGVKRLVYSSSASVYGDAVEIP